MLKMAQVHCIKHLREQERASIEDIRKITGLNWRTVKKYADRGISMMRREKQRRARPVMEPVAEIIDAWIEENELFPRSQRMTARRIYKRLKKETGFVGAESTVRRYVRRRREQLKLERGETGSGQYVRLEHPAGSSQADFGKFMGIEESSKREKQYHCLNMSFPYSNAGMGWILPAENGECFLHGLSQIFWTMGGVPPEIWFDNATGIVKKVLEGEDRELQAMFKEFQWYYRFKAVFCNPGAAHEKGSVEGKVGYSRRNYLSPPSLVIGDTEETSRELVEKLIEDMQRDHYAKGERISELWEEDRKHLLRLPDRPMEICTSKVVRVNGYGEITVKEQTYHVTRAQKGMQVLCKIYWDRIDVYDRYGEMKIGSYWRKYTSKSKEIDWKGELRIYERRPRAIERASYLKALPEAVREYLLVKELKERPTRVKAVLELLEEYSMAEIEQAVEEAKMYGRYDLGSVKAIASYRQAGGYEEGMKDVWTPAAMVHTEQDLSEYDSLAAKEVRGGE
jgi:transposase